MKRQQRTIGGIVHPSWNYDIEASLTVHQMLLQRATDSKWRFTGRWVTTGPYETLCGKPGTGRSCTTKPHGSLAIYPALEGLEQMVRKINQSIFRTLCEFPGFASLDETVSLNFVHCGKSVDGLAAFECGRTRQRLNQHWKQATLVRDVALYSRGDGVYLDASVTFNRKPTESRWGLFWLLGEPSPKQRSRERLTTFLQRAERVLAKHVQPTRKMESSR